MRQMLLYALCIMLLSCGNNATEPAKSAASDSSVNSAAPSKPRPTEFADEKYKEIGKKGLAQLSGGDIDGWMGSFADNAVYSWSTGDSLVGKEAIAKYWKERRTKVLDSLGFSLDIWLPIKVNQPQQGPDMPGVWLLGWYQVHANYKGGKKLVFWVHTDQHFNDKDQVDRVVQYIDRAPIEKAMAHK